MPIYDWGGHLDDLHDIDALLADWRRQQADEARAEELGLYRSRPYVYRDGKYSVERGR